MRQILLVTLFVILAVSVIAAGFTLNQANQEQLDLAARLQSRTQLLAESLADSVTPAFRSYATSSVQTTVDKFVGEARVSGLGVYDTNTTPVALSKDFPPDARNLPLVGTVMDSKEPSGVFLENGALYAFATPLLAGENVIGALVVTQSSQYINDAVWGIWSDNLVRLFLQLLFFAGAIYVLVRWAFLRPLTRLAESIRSVRSGEAVETPNAEHALFTPLTAELSKITTSLRQARHSASEEARMRLEKLDSPWTAERLKEFIKAYLKDRPIFVISNREPYVHSKGSDGITVSVPAGGVITALEPVMQACGGTWIAHGSGNADKETADADGKLRVPPEEPHYTLKRVWLSEKEVQGHYVGFSNEALWPLCHMAHTRPIFRAEDWATYRKVNGLFAKTLLTEMRHIERPLIVVNDYHFALLPALIKKSRPDAQVVIFWHIPWPSPESFSVCPWRHEILQGMLGADLIGFHTQQYCNNFIDTVSAEVESLIDYEHFSIARGGHRSFIKPFPISIALPGSAEPAKKPSGEILERLGIGSEFLGLGVDRLDYTKGLLERFRGIEFFFDAHPEFREHFTFLQIASPSRESVEKYREYAEEVLDEAKRINKKFATRDWRPIHLEHRNYTHSELLQLYQLAHVCMVTSLHDGMNLVAKEYVAARTEEDGVLLLSKFTGASRDLKSALSINPYSAEETAAALHQALTMSPSEQHRRMKGMRNAVRDYNVYRWSAEMIKALVNIS